MEISADEFNEKYSVGTQILWFPSDEPPIISSITISPALYDGRQRRSFIQIQATEKRIGSKLVPLDQIEVQNQALFDNICRILDARAR